MYSCHSPRLKGFRLRTTDGNRCRCNGINVIATICAVQHKHSTPMPFNMSCASSRPGFSMREPSFGASTTDMTGIVYAHPGHAPKANRTIEEIGSCRHNDRCCWAKLHLLCHVPDGESHDHRRSCCHLSRLTFPVSIRRIGRHLAASSTRRYGTMADGWHCKTIAG